MHQRHSPHATRDSMATLSPTVTLGTASPTSTTSPASSWPVILHTLSGLVTRQPCRSLPQIPEARTLANTSFDPRIFGLGTSLTSRVPSAVQTAAFIISVKPITSQNRCALHDIEVIYQLASFFLFKNTSTVQFNP